MHACELEVSRNKYFQPKKINFREKNIYLRCSSKGLLNYIEITFKGHGLLARVIEKVSRLFKQNFHPKLHI